MDGKRIGPKPQPRRQPRGVALAVALALVGAMPATANDSAASISAGGLVLLQQPWIEMAEEYLHITPRRVEVTYLFHNHGDQPIETLVAFPLPEVGAPSDWGGDSALYAAPADGGYVDFTTRINGSPVAMQVEHRARLNGIDVTDRLRALSVPLVPYDTGAQARLAALPESTRRVLREELLIDAEGWPAWRMQTTYFWRQVFPPHAGLRVEHSYVPLSGGSVDWPVGMWPRGQEPDDWSRGWVEGERQAYCVDPAVERRMLAQRHGQTGLPPHTFGTTTLGYILSTGSNWRGPIGRFHLTIETDHPADYVFACLDGMRREGPGRITAELTDFWPRQELSVLFAHAYGEDIPRD